MNDSLVLLLAHVYEDDQQLRKEMENLRTMYQEDTAKRSGEMRRIISMMRIKDSLNTGIVSSIIDRYGWPGPSVVGESGNTAMFLVIQHASLPVQEKYLLVLRKAMEEKQLKAGSFALLEDRVAIRNGNPQVYGSQLVWDGKQNRYYIFPIEDPEHLDERRAGAGLPSMQAYLAYFKMNWDIKKYKKELPYVMSHYMKKKE